MKSSSFQCFTAVLLVLACSSRPLRAGEVERDAVASRGLEWLASQQREDGSFSQTQFPALTGLALWALAGSGQEEYAEQIERATAFLVGCVQPDGGIYQAIPGRRGGGLATYNTAICLTALHATGRADLVPVLLGARSFLASAQELEDPVFRGGFGYDRVNERSYTDLMNTHFVLDAMRRTQGVEEMRPTSAPRADIQWESALAYLEGLQNPEDSGPDNAGGFFYTHNDPKAGTDTVLVQTAAGEEERVILRSYGSITYAGLLSLVHCRLTRDDPRVVSALDWASRHWTLEENPGMGDQGLYFFYNVLGRALQASGVGVIPRPHGESVAWREALTAQLAGLQREDGSWLNENGRFWENDPVLTTAYALIALQSAASAP